MIPIIRTHPKLTNFTKFYPKVFRRHAHILVANGYMAIRSSINKDTEEPTITIRIYQWIKNSLKEYKNLPTVILDCRYNIFAEPPIIDKEDVKNKKDAYRFLDIVVEDSQFVPRRELIFEAKRLRKGDFTISKYCSDGITRFVDSTYGAQSFEAVMLGFWQDATLEHWIKQLTTALKKDAKKNMKVKKNLRKVKIITGFPDEWMSRHERPLGTDIILFHIFLDCR